MTAFAALPATSRHFLAVLLFLGVLSQLFLCLFQAVCHSERIRRIFSGGLLLLLLAACAYVLAEIDGNAGFPWLLVPVVFVIVCAGVWTGLQRERRASRERLSPASIKETLDNLNAGILFSDERGRVILINRAMGGIFTSLLGSYPQMRSEITEALKCAESLPDDPDLYRLPDGRVWRFQTVPLDDREPAGFFQTTAQDVTEFYEVNRQLAVENAELRAAIEQTTRLLDRVAERVREQETLDIKVRVHNDIGKSLIALSELVQGGTDAPDEQLRTLRRAVGLFAGGRPSAPGRLEDVRREAAELRVTLTVEGILPQDGKTESLIAAAARECVTNCVRHAKGSLVNVRLAGRDGFYTVTFTNDGAPPAGPVAEGGGLSSVRQGVEAAGGSMRVSHSPRFALILRFPEKETFP
ncbi:MAG: hypothetical protein IKR07_04775 [Oscillospiraceae bacterium]|nr:hypothetical protein [Oscillospiraceae bacterium]